MRYANLDDATVTSLYGMMIIGAVLASGGIRGIYVALIRQTSYSNPTTQRRRYGCALFSFVVSAIPTGYMLYQHGLDMSITVFRAFIDVSPTFGTAAACIAAFNALVVVATPLVIVRIFVCPTLFAHKTRNRAGSRVYLTTVDSRRGVISYDSYGIGKRSAQLDDVAYAAR